MPPPRSPVPLFFSPFPVPSRSPSFLFPPRRPIRPRVPPSSPLTTSSAETPLSAPRPFTVRSAGKRLTRPLGPPTAPRTAKPASRCIIGRRAETRQPPERTSQSGIQAGVLDPLGILKRSSRRCSNPGRCRFCWSTGECPARALVCPSASPGPVFGTLALPIQNLGRSLPPRSSPAATLASSAKPRLGVPPSPLPLRKADRLSGVADIRPSVARRLESPGVTPYTSPQLRS